VACRNGEQNGPPNGAWRTLPKSGTKKPHIRLFVGFVKEK
jgi:hypothetical protein